MVSSVKFLKEKKSKHVEWRQLTKYAAFSIPILISSDLIFVSYPSKSSSYSVVFSSPKRLVSGSFSSSLSLSDSSLSNCVGNTKGSISRLDSSSVPPVTPFVMYVTV